MKKFLSPFNIVFLLHGATLASVVFGLVPREATLFLFGVVFYFLLFAPREDAFIYFVRSIPFFVALPVSDTFDSLNMWRIAVIVLFLRWGMPYIRTVRLREVYIHCKDGTYWNKYRGEVLWIFFVGFALLSLVAALDMVASLKRVIYLVNILLLYPVAVSFAKNKEVFIRIMRNILLSAGMVAAIGYIQLFTTYQWDFMRFVTFWTWKVQYVFYGNAWANIVYNSNTWFAYLGGEGLRLRVFSTFPDSHSLPLFFIFSLASVTAILYPFFVSSGIRAKLASLFRVHRNDYIGLSMGGLFFLLLLIILTGTRGIWISVLFPFVAVAGGYIFLKGSRPLVRFTGTVLLIFILLIPVASYLFSFPQFTAGTEVEKSESRAFFKRFKSTFDTEETSNQGRIFIWTHTIRSVFESPLFGVGIGNFPVVLNQDVKLAKAGSSAHNLYLQIAAEMGLLALGVFFLVLWQYLQYAWRAFRKAKEGVYRTFGWAAILSFLWVLGYSLTDAALFDERAFLSFVLFLAMIRGADQS